MKIFRLVLTSFMAVIIGLSSCDEDEKVNDKIKEVPEFPDLKIYLDRFEQEAAKLGYNFDLSGVERVYLDEIKEGDQVYCGKGYSNYYGKGIRRIVISRSGQCNFLGKTDVEKEHLIFHEIGHAFFARGHDDATQCNGTFLSLMHSKANLQDVYKESEKETRAYYIAELIDSSKALDKCVSHDTNWEANPKLYTYTKEDSLWYFGSANGAYSGVRTDDNRILISSDLMNPADEDGYWYTEIEDFAIPECAEVTLKVRMNSTGLKGPGVAVAVRLYEGRLAEEGTILEQSVLLNTEEGTLTGQLNNHVAEVTIPCFTRKTLLIMPFLVLLKGSEGRVDFDQIEIVVTPK